MADSRSRWLFIPLVVALLFVGVASVAYAIGVASGGSPTALAAGASTVPGHPELGPGWTAPPTINGSTGQVAITITKIDGSKLSLQTTDGWTRAIDATGATITKGGKTIALADLAVGDQINFRESRQSDGTYKITSIAVLSPTASGTVTAVGSSSVTIKQSDGTSRTLTLTGFTTYSQAGAKVTQSALVVGVRISAQGTVDSSGSLTATSITIGQSSVGGTVASKTATTIVVTTAANKTVTVDVSSSTRYSVRGVTAPTLANVGERISAQGTFNADGSLNASVVQAFPIGQPGFGGSGGSGSSGGRGFGGGSGGSGSSGGRGFGGGSGGSGRSPTPRPSAAASGATT
jgi:hypothetical protein